MRQRPVQDISELPTYGFGSVSPIWWGTLGFIALGLHSLVCARWMRLLGSSGAA